MNPQPFKVCGDKFTDELADMSCRSMGYKEMISWETRDGTPLYDGKAYINLEKCPDNSRSFADCPLKTGACSSNKTQVFLHCKGRP